MKDDLAVANRKVIDLAGLGETIGLKVLPFLLAQITLVKINVNYSYLGTCLVHVAGMLFLNMGYFKQIKDAFGKNYTCQRLNDGWGCLFPHAEKVTLFLLVPVQTDIWLGTGDSATDFCAWAIIIEG